MTIWKTGDSVSVRDDEGSLPATIVDPGETGRTWLGWPVVTFGNGNVLVNPNDLEESAK